MANVSLPQDQKGNAVQALAPSTNANVAIGAASANVALPAGAEVVRIAASCNCFINFGNSTITASGTSPVFNAGAEIFKVPVGATHIAVIQNGAVTGTLSATRMV